MDVHPPKYGTIGFDPWPYQRILYDRKCMQLYYMQRIDNNGACLAKSWLDTQDDTQCWGSIYPENTEFLKQHAMTSACTRTQFKRTHYPGKRPQTVGAGAKGDENCGGDDEDDDTYEST